MSVQESILQSVKKLSRVAPEDEVYDDDFLLHINTVFADLHQLGVGPNTVFQIEDKEATWSQFTGGNDALNSVKSYIVNRLRLLFDPPTTSFGITAVEKQIKEHEWRLMEAAEEARTLAPSASPFTSVTPDPFGAGVNPETLTS